MAVVAGMEKKYKSQTLNFLNIFLRYRAYISIFDELIIECIGLQKVGSSTAIHQDNVVE